MQGVWAVVILREARICGTAGWYSREVLVTPEPAGGGGEKWWKAEVRRLRAAYGITDPVIIIREKTT